MSHKFGDPPCTDENCWCMQKLVYTTFDGQDMVNHPKHYMIQVGGVEIEVLDLIKATLSEEELKGYLIGNITKYLLRHKKKNNVEDLKKMAFYSRELDELI